LNIRTQFPAERVSITKIAARHCQAEEKRRIGLGFQEFTLGVEDVTASCAAVVQHKNRGAVPGLARLERYTKAALAKPNMPRPADDSV
jgi:hypothetical protein